jgi:hypothetical protein
MVGTLGRFSIEVPFFDAVAKGVHRVVFVDPVGERRRRRYVRRWFWGGHDPPNRRCPIGGTRWPSLSTESCTAAAAPTAKSGTDVDVMASGSMGWETSWYHDVMTKQTTVRLPDGLADDAEAVARVRGESVNKLIIDSLAAEIDRVRADESFTARAKKLLERDQEILDRLAK